MLGLKLNILVKGPMTDQDKYINKHIFTELRAVIIS